MRIIYVYIYSTLLLIFLFPNLSFPQGITIEILETSLQSKNLFVSKMAPLLKMVNQFSRNLTNDNGLKAEEIERELAEYRSQLESANEEVTQSLLDTINFSKNNLELYKLEEEYGKAIQIYFEEFYRILEIDPSLVCLKQIFVNKENNEKVGYTHPSFYKILTLSDQFDEIIHKVRPTSIDEKKIAKWKTGAINFMELIIDWGMLGDAVTRYAITLLRKGSDSTIYHKKQLVRTLVCQEYGSVLTKLYNEAIKTIQLLMPSNFCCAIQ